MRPESLILLLLMGGVIFMMFSRTRRQQREAQQVQASITPGSRIMTTAGLFATVVEVDDQAVVLETAPGQRSRWDRRAVARILPETSVEAEGPTGIEAAGTDEGAGARLDHGTTESEPPYRASSASDNPPPDRV